MGGRELHLLCILIVFFISFFSKYQFDLLFVQVCIKWRDAVYSRSVWRGVTARLHLRKSNPIMILSLVRRGIRQVQVLSLRKSLRDVVQGMPALSLLDLSGCYNLSDSVLETGFNRTISSLTSINLSLCKELTDNSLGRIATHCKNLEILDLGGCTKITNTGLLLISLGLRKLVSLNLRSCWQITDTGLSHLSRTDGEERTERLVLENLVLQDCQKLSDESLRYISEGFKSLRRINLSFCASITDTGMKFLSKMSSMSELNLRFCDNISDIGVGYLAEGCVGLHSLDVSFCERVTDGSMAHIASGLFSLNSLAMASCRIQDEGIIKISKTLLDLDTLNIGQCARITDRSLISLGSQLKKLRSIDLYGCPRITPIGLNYLKDNLELKTINTGLWQAEL